MSKLPDNNITINSREIVVNVPAMSEHHSHNSKIPPDLLPTVYEMRGQGKTLEQIQKWLFQERAIDITISSLSRRLRKINQLNQAVAQAVYLKSAVQGADQIVELMDESITELANTHRSLLSQGLFSEARMYRETLLKYMSKKMDFVAMGDNKAKEENSDSVDIDELLERMGDTQSYQLGAPPDNEGEHRG